MHVGVVGCGVVGAAIAYELSQSGIQVTVFDRQQPGQAATGAALGVLMGAISQKIKGSTLQMRLDSLHRYNQWIPELEASTGRRIPFNQQGILRLCFVGEDLQAWRSLASVRQQQGWRLEIYDPIHLAVDYPQLNLERVIGAVYSPDDRQVDPVALTEALVTAAEQHGAVFRFHTPVVGMDCQSIAPLQRCQSVHTPTETLAVDWLVLAAGLGSTPLTATLQRPVVIRPVLGQAVRVQLAQPLGHPQLQPVITGDDVHIVPLGSQEYWVGATVEFTESVDAEAPIADAARLEAVMQQAIAICPGLAAGTIVHSWLGLRPRPEGRPAPIIERLPGYENVLLATGHYRNGVLLAPATAVRVRQMLSSHSGSHLSQPPSPGS